MGLQDEVKQFIQSELLDDQAISADDPLLLSGLVDSMGVMRLISHLETHFSIKIPPEDVTIENFATAAEIARYVQEQQAS